jgi:hypothetical protein
MAIPTQYSFDLDEVATALIKQGNIHEGKWWAVFEFNLGTGMFGQTPSDVLPGGFVQIKRVLLAQAGDPPPPERLVVDAAVVNPARPEKSGGGKSK